MLVAKGDEFLVVEFPQDLGAEIKWNWIFFNWGTSLLKLEMNRRTWARRICVVVTWTNQVRREVSVAAKMYF